MFRRRMQAWPVACAVVYAAAAIFPPITRAAEPPRAPDARPATAPAFDPAATKKQLANECDALLARMVKRPYGIALPADDAPAAPDEPAVRKRPPGPARPSLDPVAVSMSPAHTPTAGLILLLAGEHLRNPAYTDAARQVARGIAAAQDPTGRVPERAIFGRAAGGRDPAVIVPDRAPTRAALALLLVVLDAQGDKPDETTRRAAVRAAQWLARQQPAAGGWPIAIPNDLAAPESLRIVPLERREYRDNTLALLLTFEVLHDPNMKHAAQRSIDMLLRMRFAESRSARHLWPTAAEPSGEATRRIDDFPRGVDLVSARYALQTLFAYHLVLADEAAGQAVDDAVKGIAALPQENGRFYRLYPLWRDEVRPTRPDVRRPPDSRPGEVFAKPEVPVPDSMTLGRFGIDPVLASVEQLKELGRAKFQDALADHFPYKTRIALAATELTDAPMELSLPRTSDAARAWLAAGRDDLLREANGRPGPSPADRLRHVYALLVRSKVETLAAHRP